MAKTKGDVAQRAWSLLRLALLWARKGGVFRRRLMMELRLLPKFLKGLAHHQPHRHHQLMSHYKERQLSFDETPIFHIKMHRPASMRFLLPCISTEEVDFDYDFGPNDYDGVYGYNDGGRKSYSTASDTDEEDGEVEECGYEGCDEKENSPYYAVEEEGIDSKAEKFIASFYEQMRLQSQVSYLEYSEKLSTGSKS
ncbi:uncharacterized protein LOC108485040 [Gossypium arboreum]|uniref:Uncharacterized protein n=1 Tax=Gossypium arboreum TaxID=29729 RepID=A0ABR0PC27_GOSAR|nr:uncharacterized protein LOC108485040 [Gossypium arboreum]KAK5818753.1 hypothetical protein PVK06_023698 [Gossypium arboreum]